MENENDDDGPGIWSAGVMRRLEQEADLKRQGNVLRGKKAKAVGKTFEALVSLRLKALERDGVVAHWQHNEPLFRMLFSPGRFGKPIRRFMPVGAGVSDYTGMFHGGLTFALEAKSWSTARFPLSQISDRQQEHLTKTAEGGGLAFLAVEFRSGSRVRDYLIPWLEVPWGIARSAKTILEGDVAEREAPRCDVARYMGPYVLQCPKCRLVKPRTLTTSAICAWPCLVKRA